MRRFYALSAWPWLVECQVMDISVQAECASVLTLDDWSQLDNRGNLLGVLEAGQRKVMH